MQSDKRFVRERFVIVKEEREKIDQMMVDEPHKVDNWEKIIVRREYRLLGKLLAEVPEGRILAALEMWRDQHCAALQAHRRRTRDAQNAADDYWRLSAMEREDAGRPPPNPSAGIETRDRHGELWVIDDRYIMMMDRLIEQLQRWLAYENRASVRRT